MAWRNLVLLGLFVSAALYWLSAPPDRVAFDEGCDPSDLQASLSALVRGDAFWRSQRDQAMALAEILVAQRPADSSPGGRSVVSPIEQKMLRLSQKESTLEQAAQQRDRLEKLAWLSRCHAAIGRRLTP